ncbi:glycoside hydrolase family 28 protein [Persicobacter psychrovividus]|uniref:Glycoside hydrolase family 28 protein n=1 Tax=Persicobacter psychrovividus TaxID=387638 RepID=A0ABM7VMN4_9BACT|nr:hypothetical protein PEPS_45590 [Persicobacter psychrovividus]
MINKVIFGLFFVFLPFLLNAKSIDLGKLGAVADGQTVETELIQHAIDLVHQSGGGKVIFPEGKTMVSGTIFLKSNVSLIIGNGTTLMASSQIKDYSTNTFRTNYKEEPHMDRCFIFAEESSNIQISGGGTIDGNGYWKNFNNTVGRPMLLRIKHCEHIRINNITFVNPASWTSAFLYSNDIEVSNIRISSRVNNNGDGLDFDGCKNVRVSNSFFDTSDDCICLQGSLPEFPVEHITITNCNFTSKWAGIRIGLLSRSDFSSVTVSNCTFNDISDAGLKIQMNEGGKMKHMTFSNLTMTNVPRPIFMTLCRQKAYVDAPEELPAMGAIEGMNFNNIIVNNEQQDKNSAIFITGMPGYKINNLQLSNIQLYFSGGGNAEDSQKNISEYTPDVLNGWWPEFGLVGTLPSSVAYFRHINGLYINNVHAYLSNPDARKPIQLLDVTNHSMRDVFCNYQPIDTKEVIK